jgi:hypothetical protein
VLKLALRRISEAEKLENLINELYTQEISADFAIRSTLQLLIELKNFQAHASGPVSVFGSLDIFNQCSIKIWKFL